ncbi:hypothetical protein [Candidatus Babela massiliensis]|uniref:Uncharacterized protein n=1 Tax=Candidatus Babela massiliensis TaxID=673862 RepID=V6DIN8_9BACT|nr:hypothetical protein [Candidatus Babela massiliensis]CDK30793.1 hypothetical protein BABL1_gene_222 [Candidatus Babela massiliensis]
MLKKYGLVLGLIWFCSNDILSMKGYSSDDDYTSEYTPSAPLPDYTYYRPSSRSPLKPNLELNAESNIILDKWHNFLNGEAQDTFEVLYVKSFLTDLVTVWQELDKINVLGSTNKKDIKAISKANKKYNIFYGPISLALNSFFHTVLNKNLGDDRNSQIVRFLNYLPSLAAWKNLYLDGYIERNAKVIAGYNRISKRDLSSTKFLQKAWFGINKILPYAFILGIKKLNSNMENASYKDLAKCFEVLKLASDISETIRKSHGYTAEMGNYERYRASLIK